MTRHMLTRAAQISALWRVVRRFDLLSYHLVSRPYVWDYLALSVLVDASHDASRLCRGPFADLLRHAALALGRC